MFDRIHLESHRTLHFICREGFSVVITASFSLLVISLFRVALSSWISLGRLRASRNLCISSRLLNLHSLFLGLFNDSLYFCCNFSFIYAFVYLGSLFFEEHS